MIMALLIPNSGVKNNTIRYVFGEMTWGAEILMARICQDKFVGKCVYLHPQSIRIPNGRFTFMDSEFQDGIYKPIEYLQSEEILKEYDIPIKPVVPERVADVARDVKKSMKLSETIVRFIRFLTINRITPSNKDCECYQTNSNNTRRKQVWNFETNKLYYKYALKATPFEEFKDKNYVFVTLHMQPEASVDVVGRYYDDQLQNIKNIWRILPSDYYLVAKEHTNALGNRGRKFFETLKKMRNVIIADENINSHLIINHSKGVFTNSGTVALETALFERHAFLFSCIFFDKLRYCHRVTLEDLKYCTSFENLVENLIKRDAQKNGCCRIF